MLIQPPERWAPRSGYNLKLSLARCAPVHIGLTAACGAATGLGLRLTLRCRSGPTGKDRRSQAAAGSELAPDDAPFGLDGGNYVAQDLVDGIFVENAQVAIGKQVHFQGL